MEKINVLSPKVLIFIIWFELNWATIVRVKPCPVQKKIFKKYIDCIESRSLIFKASPKGKILTVHNAKIILKVHPFERVKVKVC